MSETDRETFCAALEPDVAAVLRRLWQPPAGTAAAKDAAGKTSDAKFADRFHAVLGDWRGLFLELGDEHGNYVVQEHHWEAPDFDACRLTEDMERCAQDLLPLLEHAAALGLEDESLFVDLCQEITEGVGQFPDHIYAGDGVGFGPKATECLLTWLDLHVQTEAGFLEILLATLAGSGSVSFADATIRVYLLEGWPQERRRVLYHAIEAQRAANAEFREQTDSPRTLWHGIRHELARAFDAAAGLAIAEASVSDDWTQGVALVDAAMAEGNPTRALDFCRRTVDAFYRRRAWGKGAASFDPGTTPLLGFWAVHDDSAQIARILGLWADLAAQAGDQRQASLLAVQQALLTRADDWTAVRTAVAQAGGAEAEVLFRAWREQALQQQQRGVWAFGAPQNAPFWPEWLIDAGFAERFDVFTDRALAWLDETPGTGKKSGPAEPRHVTSQGWLPQMSLVAELFALGPSPRDYPALREMLALRCRLESCPARREWLGRTDVARLTTRGIEFVRRNMASLIPSPGSTGSNYEIPAGWLAVARELAPGIARSTLQFWQVEYGRRRNLWRDLRERGFEPWTDE
jgi:hypothetical protein